MWVSVYAKFRGNGKSMKVETPKILADFDDQSEMDPYADSDDGEPEWMEKKAGRFSELRRRDT